MIGVLYTPVAQHCPLWNANGTDHKKPTIFYWINHFHYGELHLKH